MVNVIPIKISFTYLVFSKIFMTCNYIDIHENYQLAGSIGLSQDWRRLDLFLKNDVPAQCSHSSFSHSTRLLAATTLRNVLGTKNLAEILSERETISQVMQNALDEATDPWGVKVYQIQLNSARTVHWCRSASLHIFQEYAKKIQMMINGLRL